MSVLYAAQRFPPAVTVLLGGALVDRHRKLALLTWGKMVGGVLLLCVPLAAYLRWLSLPLLYVVGLLLAAVNVCYQKEHAESTRSTWSGGTPPAVGGRLLVG
ncbi:hypothetical protein ACWD3I_44220 [Streptomyces sp. NPDC002817]|uniref:hypothetical protein n=1 Tax=Streptomyces sp. NPDC088357 TaxID=3154655 RepID=UPI0034425446